MAKAKAKPTKGVIDLDAPGNLSNREFYAFRLGALKTLLAAADDFGHHIPGIFRQSFENEIAWRERQLESGQREESA